MIEALIIGSVGVGLLLVAFFLNLFKVLTPDSILYIVMNIFGGSLAAYASFLIDYMPFVILEGVWALFAMYKLILVLRRGKSFQQKGRKPAKKA